MENSIFEEVKLLVNEVYGFQSISRNTIINNGKTLSEDNDVFFEEFKKRFNTNLTDFKYYDYYHEDQFIVLSLLRYLLLKVSLVKRKQPITVGHLVSVVEKGTWFKPNSD